MTTETTKADDLSPCNFCGLATKRETLTAYGARCAKCVSAWAMQAPARQRIPPEAVPADAGGLAWAYRLRWREHAGENLTKLQRHEWRRVLAANRTLDAARAGADVDQADIERALCVTGDIPPPDKADRRKFDDYGAPL